MAGNREYKSDVFSMLMEDRGRALQFCNEVNHSYYSDPIDNDTASKVFILFIIQI